LSFGVILKFDLMS